MKMASIGGGFEEDHVKKFVHLSSKFTNIIKGRGESDRQTITSLLDEMNSLDYDFNPKIISSKNKAVLVINQICTLVPSNDTFLIAKGCQLIRIIIDKQNIKVEGKTLTFAINWCIQSLKFCANIALVDVLLALESLLKANGIFVEDKIHSFLGSQGILTQLLASETRQNPSKEVNMTSPWEIKLLCLRCIKSLISPCGANKQENVDCCLKEYNLELCFHVFSDWLNVDIEEHVDMINYCKILTICLEGLEFIFEQNKTLLLQYLGEALGIAKAYILFGLPGHSGLRPQKIYPTPISQYEIKESIPKYPRLNKNIRRRRSRGGASGAMIKSGNDCSTDDHVNPDGPQHLAMQASLYPTWQTFAKPQLIPSTSESELSDSETNQTNKIRTSFVRVRHSSLSFLNTIIKECDKRVLFGYWSALVPDSAQFPQTRTLITCILKEPSSRCRLAAVGVLVTLLLESKFYLSQAEYSERINTAFTPFSLTLGNMIIELHRSLCLALVAENSHVVVTLLLKCIAALVQNSPYHRLGPGLITKVVSKTRTYLTHKGPNVQVAALAVYGCIVSIDPPLPEVIEVITKKNKTEGQIKECLEESDCQNSQEITNENNESDYEEPNEEQESLQHLSCSQSWLLDLCLKNLGAGLPSRPAFIPIRIESLQVLTVMVKNYFSPVLIKHLSKLREALDPMLNDPDAAVALHAGRVLEALGMALHKPHSPDKERALPLEEVLGFWRIVLKGPLISLVQNPNHATLRSVGVDCLATIEEDIFEQLPTRDQILVVTLLFGCSNDEEFLVRASAIRALAYCVFHESLRNNPQFIEDTALAAIRSLADTSLYVRTKASWSMGKFCDALVRNREEEKDDIPESLLFHLLESSVKAAQDNERVRSNVMRAIGNLMRLLSEEMLKQTKFKELFEKAIAALIKNATTGNNMKIRWNACYAIGNILRNEVLYTENSTWLHRIFVALSSLVQNFKNFKVRINAALALAIPSSRQQYGNHYIFLWEALLNGLENSQDMEDFSEYKHRDNLIDQLCISLIHLASLATKEDLINLQDLLSYHLESLEKYILKFQERVLPEISSILIKTSNHVLTLKHLPELNVEQENAAILLSNIFSEKK